MKIYLADSLKNVENTRKVAAALTEIGHEVTSTWLNYDYSMQLTDPCDNFPLCEKLAEQNLRDINNSEALAIFFFDGMKSAGKNIEFGYTLAINQFTRQMKIFVVGEWNSVFHSLGYAHFKTSEVFLEYMKTKI